MDEATPLLHPQPKVTFVDKTQVTTVPFTQPFHQPPESIAIIITPTPVSSLPRDLNLPQLPKPAYPRLQSLASGCTLTLPTLTVSANSRTILVVTKNVTPPIPPDSTIQSILALFAISTVPSFLRSVDVVGNALDTLEASSLTQKHSTEVEQIWRIRREVSRLRRHGVSLRHLLRCLSVPESTIRNLQIGLDTLSLIRDSAHGALELLLALQNNRMQETMQTLAVVTTIFVPLTFLAGIEGMNFVNQPELSWGWSYAAFWAVVVALVIGQIIFFRRRGWI